MQDRLLLLRQLRAQRITRIWLVTSGLVLLGLAVAGGAMRLTQASGGNLLSADVFYEVMSVHGSGMVVVGLMAAAGVLWYLVSNEIELSVTVNRIVFLLTLSGLVLIVLAVLVFGYSSAWTFLYPLPENPGSGIATAAIGAAAYLIGLALAVVGFLLWCLDFLRAGLKRCGSLQRLLGFYVFGPAGHGHAGDNDPTATNPSLIAGTVCAILGLSACVIGALIVVLMLISLVFPSLTLNALVAKNMIYFTLMAMAGWAIGGFGAVIDSTISLNQFFHNTLWVPAHFHTYMALGVMFFLIGATYHVIPKLTGRRMRENVGRRAAALMGFGGYGLVLCWYISGSMSAPRRYLYPLTGTEALAWIAVACAAVALTGAVMVCYDLVDVFLTSPHYNLPKPAPSPELAPSEV